MATIMTLVIGNESNYTSGTALRNAANDLSLSLREAQIYGISVRKAAGVSDFTSGFGVHFDLGANTSYTFFADKDSNTQYGSGEGQSTVSLPLGDKVNKLCVTTTSGESCSASGTLDVSFLRPAIEAKIYQSFYVGPVTGARIELSTPDGSLKRSVLIYSTGQISVQ